MLKFSKKRKSFFVYNNFFFQNFFLTFLLRWKPILKKEKKIFFIYFSDLRSFLRFFSTKMLFEIFTSIWGQILPNLARIHYFWCFSIKNINLKKKIILTLFWKNRFFQFFRIFKKFLGSNIHKIFFFTFFCWLGSKQLIYAKKLEKKYFRRYGLILP